MDPVVMVTAPHGTPLCTADKNIASIFLLLPSRMRKVLPTPYTIVGFIVKYVVHVRTSLGVLDAVTLVCFKALSTLCLAY